MELKICDNNQQCCGLMHHASEGLRCDIAKDFVVEEIKLIIGDLHDVPELYIDGERKERIVSIEYLYETDTTVPGTNAYKVVFLDKDAKGNSYERTIAVKKFPSSEFRWITK